MMTESRKLALLETSKLKLAAKARLAESGKDARFEASVLFHAAVRAEARALSAVEAPTAETRLASAVERCGCLVDGLDPTAVLDWGWGEVLEASRSVPETTAKSLRARLDPAVDRFIAQYTDTLDRLPAVRDWIVVGSPLPAPPSVGRKVDKLLDVFPGDARLWGMRGLIHFHGKDFSRAWAAIRRARSLSPDDSLLEHGELYVGAMHLPAERAEALLDAAHARIVGGESNTDLCWGVAIGELVLWQRRSDRVDLLQKALDAAEAGRVLPLQRPNDTKVLRAMQLILRELIAGRQPGLDIFYRCGLGAWAAGSPKDSPQNILLARIGPVRQRIAA